MWTQIRRFIGQVILLLTTPLFALAILCLDGWPQARAEISAIWRDLKDWKHWGDEVPPL